MKASPTTQQPLPRVAVLGLGPLGFPIATTLLRRDFEVFGWNRSPGPRERFVAAGGQLVSGLLRNLDVDMVLSVLPDVDQLRELLAPPHELISALSRAAAPLIVMSTTSPSKITALATELAKEGVPVVDAPVSGGSQGAAAGSLSVMVGADPAVFARVEAVLHGIGGTVELLGPVGHGSLAKLCNQLIVAGNLSVLAEALLVAERGGIDGSTMLRLLEGGLADSAVLRAKGERLLKRDFADGGSARNQLKDLNYATTIARDLKVATPIGDAALKLFAATAAAGMSDCDHSVVAEVLRNMSGSAATANPD